jgi:hypothetical protein
MWFLAFAVAALAAVVWNLYLTSQARPSRQRDFLEGARDRREPPPGSASPDEPAS